MNHLRFGALLMMRGRRLGIYLSHRVVLTIPKPGPIRAAALKDFQPAQVFACQGIAVPFFEALATAATTQKHFTSSLEMVKHLLRQYDYPPEGQKQALEVVMQQCEQWAEQEYNKPLIVNSIHIDTYNDNSKHIHLSE